jgi:ankyrin repeat protein
MEFLLEKGADSNSHDRQMRTPLHEASENGHFDAIFLLLNRGADVNAKDSHLWTPLHMASKTGNLTVAVELLDHGADAKAQDDLGWTPLHIASQEGHQGVVRLLLNHRAHVDAVEADHETALHLAAYYGQFQVTQFLFDSGANVHALNKNEKRPSDLASAEGHNLVAKLLLSFEERTPVAEQEELSEYDGAYSGPSRQPDYIASPRVENRAIAHTTSSSSYTPQVSTHSVSQDDLDECLAWFLSIDQDGDEELTIEELQSALLNNRGLRFSITTVKYLVSIFDQNDDGVIGFEEFHPLWNYLNEWRQMFDSFDFDHNGTIDATELDSVMAHYRLNVSTHILDQIVMKYAPSSWQAGHGNIPARAQMDLDHFVCVCVSVRRMCELYEECSAGGQSSVSIDDFLQAIISLP